MKPTEQQIHISIVSYLRRVLPDGYILHHSRNEGNRGGFKGKLDGQRGKQMGVMPGFPDLFLIIDGRSFGIEIKREGAYQTATQKEAERNMQVQGIKYAVCRSVDDVRETLAAWGVRTKETPPNDYRRLRDKIVGEDAT